MSTVYASVNISKKLKAVLKPGTAFLVETDDIGSGQGRISFELKDGIDPSVVAALGASSVSIAPTKMGAPAPAPVEVEPNYPETMTAEPTQAPLATSTSPQPPPPQVDSDDMVQTENLTGGAKPVANFSAKKIVKKKPVPEKQVKTAQKKAPAPKQPAPAPAQPAQQRDSITDMKSFYEFLNKVEYDPNALQKDEKRMNRTEAVNAEKQGAIGSGTSMYIVNVCGAQLVIEDLGIRLLRGGGYNLGYIPAEKLKASTHLFEALNAGQIKFAPREVADKASMQAVKRQEQITRGDDPSDIYDKADDVYDEIEDGTVDDAAVNAVPQHLRSAASMEIDGDEDYTTEFDMIAGDVESRESELQDNPPPAEQVPGRRVVERETR